MNFDQKAQVASLAAILIGFAMVFWELQQNRDMTVAMLASEGAIARADLDMRIAEFAGTYARACEGVQAMTAEDAIVMTQIYRAFFESHLNRLLNYDKALGAGVNWQSNATAFFRFMFETEFGRNHWKRIQGGFEEKVQDIGNATLDGMGRPSCFAPKTLEL